MHACHPSPPLASTLPSCTRLPACHSPPPRQALSATHEAIQRFDAAGTPWQRPLDFFAGMVKSDEHMAKVKEQLMFEQKQIEMADDR